jgi:nitrogen fixation protein FixH
MSWGTKIVITFIVFVAMIISMIVVCMKQDVSLVSKDYYKQEIAYEGRIEELRNTQSLGQKLQMLNSNGQLNLTFPSTLKFEEVEGEIHFFRPSDATQDKKVKLALNNQGQQMIDLSTLPAGYWKVKISWKDSSKNYYEEKTLHL